MTVVCAHQPNWLPGMSVIRKIEQSDIVIWLDEVQYSKGGYTNRNRLPDGSWMTVPVRKRTDGLPINRVRISDKPWREKMVKTLWQHFGKHWRVTEVCREVMSPYELLVGLNLAALAWVTPNDVGWRFQSHLDGGRRLVAVSDDEAELRPISERLARMVDLVGGDVYLSGPSGFRYLDETPFHELDIEVKYFSFHEPNPCVLDQFRQARRIG